MRELEIIVHGQLHNTPNTYSKYSCHNVEGMTILPSGTPCLCMHVLAVPVGLIWGGWIEFSIESLSVGGKILCSQNFPLHQ